MKVKGGTANSFNRGPGTVDVCGFSADRGDLNFCLRCVWDVTMENRRHDGRWLEERERGGRGGGRRGAPDDNGSRFKYT